MPDLVLPRELHDRCVAMARAALPNEACGLLAGAGSPSIDGPVVVTSVYPVPNSLKSPTRFALDGNAMIAAEDQIDDEGGYVVGVVHSHPTSAAVPSRRDLLDAGAFDPSHAFIHMIVSMQGFAPTLRAYRYTARGAVELDVLGRSRA